MQSISREDRWASWTAVIDELLLNEDFDVQGLHIERPQREEVLADGSKLYHDTGVVVIVVTGFMPPDPPTKPVISFPAEEDLDVFMADTTAEPYDQDRDLVPDNQEPVFDG